MATAEVLKITHEVDDKAKVLIDGMQMSQSVLHPFLILYTTLATENLQQTADETKEIVLQTASNVDDVKRMSFSNFIIAEAQSSSQRTRCVRIFGNGCLHQISRRITTLPAVRSMKGQRLGCSKEERTRNGSRLLLSCGFTANVCFFPSYHCLEPHASMSL
jgi:hypothetical protein